MLDALSPSPPGRLKRLETLLRSFWDASQLRRLIANACGAQVTSQLPEACSHEILAHGAVTVLDRNGMIRDELFAELITDRPNQRAHIEDVAREHGIVNLPSVIPTVARKRRIRPIGTPDFVVRDTYRRLRRQHALLRKLTHGELHVARLFDIALRQQTKAMKTLPRRIVTWIEKNHHEFTLPELSSALTAVRAVASVFAVSPEAGLIGSLVGLSTQGGRNAVKQLMSFAELSDQSLYLLALKLIEAQA